MTDVLQDFKSASQQLEMVSQSVSASACHWESNLSLSCLPPVPAVSSQPVSNLKWSASQSNLKWSTSPTVRIVRQSDVPPDLKRALVQILHLCQSLTAGLGNYLPSVAFSVARERQKW